MALFLPALYSFSYLSITVPAVGCRLLSLLLPLGSELTEALSSQPKLLPVFKDYFDTVVLLAGTNRENGHLILSKAVEQWLPACIQLLKGKEEEENASEGGGGKVMIPVGSLLQYLSHLTSAVQFITNMVKCTEMRSLAGDSDSLVQVIGLSPPPSFFPPSPTGLFTSFLHPPLFSSFLQWPIHSFLFSSSVPVPSLLLSSSSPVPPLPYPTSLRSSFPSFVLSPLPHLLSINSLLSSFTAHSLHPLLSQDSDSESEEEEATVLAAAAEEEESQGDESVGS